MLGILGFEFFRNAVIAGLNASIVCGIIGSYVVVKRLVSMSGGPAHASFGGVGIGYFLGIDPFLGAAGFTLGIAFLIAAIREKFGQYMETLIGAVWAAGMSVGILFMVPSPQGADEFGGGRLHGRLYGRWASRPFRGFSQSLADLGMSPRKAELTRRR